MSSRFSEDRVHQLQTSMRHASRSPPTRRGGHLPPPTLILSIPITLAFVSCMLAPVQRDICHVIVDLPVYMQTIYVSRAFFAKRKPHVTPLRGMWFSLGRWGGEFYADIFDDVPRPPPLSGTLSRDSHLKTAYFRHFITRACFDMRCRCRQRYDSVSWCFLRTCI